MNQAEWRRYRLLFVGGNAALLVLLFLVAGFSLWLLSAVRAYVAGEGFWSKSQKDAVSHVRRYAASGNEADYQRFVAELAVPLADHEARLELQKPSPDIHAAERALIRGRNHPGDVQGMVLMFRWFQHRGPVKHAIQIWTEADPSILELRDLAEALHREMASPRTDRNRVDVLLQKIDAVNDRVTPLENSFSETLGEAVRSTWRRVVLAVGAITGSLILVGVLFSRKLLRQIQESEQQYRHFLETANDAIFITDRKTGIVLEANHKAAEMTRLNPAGQRFDRFVEGASHESVVRPASGEEIRVDVSSSVTRIHDREVTVSIVRDMTEQRMLQEQLAESARLEAIGRMAGGIAHDFNNLLAGITIYSSEARREARSPRIREAFEQILRATNSGTRLIEHLLAFSRNQQLAPETFDVNEALRGIQVFLSRLLGSGVVLTTDLAPEPLPVRADPTRFEQAIINLAVNGRDAMPNGGSLLVRTRLVAPSAIARNGRPVPFAGEGVLITVEDHGNGMDLEVQAHAFDPFFSTKPNGRGTGLGLSSVFGTARQSGGDVWISSSPGHGAAIGLLLPMVRGLRASNPAS